MQDELDEICSIKHYLSYRLAAASVPAILSDGVLCAGCVYLTKGQRLGLLG